jgi:hypothetical protein
MKTFSLSKETKSRGPQYGIFMLVVTLLILVGGIWLMLSSAKGSSSFKTGYEIILCGLPLLAIAFVAMLFMNPELTVSVDDDGIESKITKPFRNTNRLAWKDIKQAKITTNRNLTSFLLVSNSGKQMGFNSNATFFDELVEVITGYLEKNGIQLIKG